nr:hypothetical protein Iba_chr07dCG6710 [Ipomoea batatas]GME01578.1 hypothetical protein Iba_contig2140CG0010 [Ipomoea batatas]
MYRLFPVYNSISYNSVQGRVCGVVNAHPTHKTLGFHALQRWDHEEMVWPFFRPDIPAEYPVVPVIRATSAERVAGFHERGRGGDAVPEHRQRVRRGLA